MSKARSTGNIGNIIKTSATCVTVNDGTTDLLIMSGSGRVTIPGNLVVLGGIAGSSAESSSYSLSSSFATNANLLDGIDGASFLQMGSFNTFSSSIDTTIKNKLNGDGVISGSVQVDITSTTGYSTFSSSLSSSMGSLSGSVATTTSGLSSSIGSLSSSVATTTSGLASRIGSVETKTGSYATTGSNVFVGSQVITGSICSNGNIVTTGQIVAQTINVQQVTSSIVYSCGSNVFGTDINNTQQFTGSMLITGSNITANVGNVCFSGTVCGSRFVAPNLTICGGNSNALISTDNNEVLRIQGHCPSGMFASFMSGSAVLGDLGNTSQVFASGNATGFGINARGTRTLEFGTNQASRLSIASTGESTFTCQMCASGIYSSASSRICGNLQVSSGGSTSIALYNEGSIRACISMTGNEGDLSLYSSVAAKNVYLSAYYDSYITGPGKFGLNCTTPFYLLDVNGTARVMNGIYFNNSGGSFLWEQGNNCLRFGTNDTERFKISGNGVSCFACQVCAPNHIASSTCSTAGLRVYGASGTHQWDMYLNGANLRFSDNTTGGCLVVDTAATFSSNVTAASLRIDNNSNLIGNGRKIFGNDDAANYYIGDIGGTGGLTINWYGGIIMRTLDTERMRITSVGITCFACQICAPSYISSNASNISYQDGQYIVGNSESEVCVLGPATSAYVPMKYWIADRTGTIRVKFSAFIVSGPNYWAYQFRKNASSVLANGHYNSTLESGYGSDVHSYTTFTNTLSGLNPGDCITYEMASANSGGSPTTGSGTQCLYVKELRFLSNSPSISNNITNNVFGEWVGIGTSCPVSNLEIRNNNPSAYDASLDNGQDGCGVTMTIRNGSTVTNSFAQLNLQVSGDSGRAVGRIALIRKDSASSHMAFVIETANTKTEIMRMGCYGASSHNFIMVGRTNAGISAGTGITLNASSGQIESSVNGDDILNLNRNVSDGKIIRLFKNCVEVGSIHTNTYSLPSDINFKTNINNLDLGLNLVNKLRPVSYNHKVDDSGSALSTGFIAQEMQCVLDELGVERNKYFILQHKPVENQNESQYWVDYTKMIPVLTKAIQEQQCTINTLKSCLGIN